jgi:hypothetical protein
VAAAMNLLVDEIRDIQARFLQPPRGLGKGWHGELSVCLKPANGNGASKSLIQFVVKKTRLSLTAAFSPGAPHTRGQICKSFRHHWRHHTR